MSQVLIAAVAQRQRNKQTEEAAPNKAARKAAEQNIAASVTLDPPMSALRPQLQACGGAVGTSKFFLQEQIKTRIKLGREYPTTVVG